MATTESESLDLRARRFVSRGGWPSGPWDAEDDRYEWRTTAGLTGLVVRGPSGALCGYVGVPSGHPAHGRSSESSDSYERDETGALDFDRPKTNPVRDLRAHGGITYAKSCAGRICHVPAPGEPEHLWWLGFDCAHSWDACPDRERGPIGGQRVYRDISYVRCEVERLAEQLAALTVSP
jgi:hypothetical protein